MTTCQYSTNSTNGNTTPLTATDFANYALPAGHRLTQADLEVLRPAPPGALRPWQLPLAVGSCLREPLQAGDAVLESHLLARPAPRASEPAVTAPEAEALTP